MAKLPHGMALASSRHLLQCCGIRRFSSRLQEILQLRKKLHTVHPQRLKGGKQKNSRMRIIRIDIIIIREYCYVTTYELL